MNWQDKIYENLVEAEEDPQTPYGIAKRQAQLKKEIWDAQTRRGKAIERAGSKFTKTTGLTPPKSKLQKVRPKLT